jgi:hypothetical protein
MEYFIELNIPEYKNIQQEVIEYLAKNPQCQVNDSYGEVSHNITLDDVPSLKTFISSRVKSKITDMKVSSIPSNSGIEVHIDGLRERIVQNDPVLDSMPFSQKYVFIIPISGYENTKNIWINNSDVSVEDELIKEINVKTFPFKFYRSSLKPDVEIEPSMTKVLDKPVFIRSDMFHSFYNYGPETRISLRMRFLEQLNCELSDIFDCEGLL